MNLILRPAAVGDAPTLEGIVLAADAPPATTAVEIRSDLTGVHVPYLTHLIGRGIVVVAERDGVAVGFGAAVDTGRARHLADLFVVPEHQGGGIGRQLLDAVYGDAWPRTTFASDDPRAMPLYLRAGMAALWPNLYLAGDPATPAAGRGRPDRGDRHGRRGRGVTGDMDRRRPHARRRLLGVAARPPAGRRTPR